VLVIDKWTNASLFENSSTPISLSAGVLYAVRMEISGGTATLSWQSASQSKQIIPATALFPGAITSYANGYNLMEGLELQSTLENDKYGWSRNSATDAYISGNNYWRARVNNKSHLIDDPSLSISFRKYNTSYSITRDLGTTTNCTKQWSVSGALLFENNYPNSDPSNEGFFEILDDQGKIISRLSVEGQYINSNTRVNQLKLNGTAIVNTEEKYVFANFNNATNFSISASGKTLTFSYANYTPITVRLYDTTANWFKPKSLKFHFHGGDYDKAIDIRQLRFTPVINTTPVISNSGQNSFCSGSSVTLTAPLGNSYSWNTSATTRSISVNSSGTYSVTVNYGNSCILSSAITTINVKPAPTPSISLFNNGLLSSYTSGNQWYMNGIIITGATSQLLRVTRSGSYSVVVTDTNGCQGTANFSVPLPFKDVKIETECINDKQVKFTWYTMDSEDEFKYGIEYTLNNGTNWIKLGEVNADKTSTGQTLKTYTLVSERSNDYKTIYRWYSLNQTGKRVQTFPVSSPTCENSSFKVYPNPFSNSLNINFDLGSHSEKSVSVDILDLNGKIVYHQILDLSSSNSQTGLISISEFEQISNGIYQLRIAGSDMVLMNEKIVKTN
ncbi:MAG: T9SS type A sorting domain-containing protein, partial [Chitinophagaceae bacterium]